MSIETRLIQKLQAEVNSAYQIAKLLRDESLTDEDRKLVTQTLCDRISLTKQGLDAFVEAAETQPIDFFKKRET